MTFWRSFKREIGKNTGKWASNKVFGEKWSTPYRFNKTLSSIENKAHKPLNNIDSSEEFISSTRSNESDYSGLYNDILNHDIKTDIESLRDTLEFLSGVVSSIGWNSNKHSIENKISNLAIEKMDIALFYLKEKSPRDYLYFKNKLNDQKKIKARRSWIIIFSIFLLLIVYFYLLNDF